MSLIQNTIRFLNRQGAKLRVEKAAHDAEDGRLVLVGLDPDGQPVKVQGDENVILEELNCIFA